MRRSYRFIAYDLEHNLIDQFALSRVTKVSGLGFKQKVSVLETETVDYIVKQMMSKKAMKLQVHFVEPMSLFQAEQFQKWLGIYINLKDTKLTFEHDNGSIARKVDVYVEDYELEGREANVTTVQLTLKPLSPNYTRTNSVVVLTGASTGKSYPYGYPYAYGGGSFEGNEITNKFVAPIPVSVTFHGKIVNPECSLANQDGDVYSTVRFNGLTLQAGQRLVVDGINQKITLYTDLHPDGIDYFNLSDKTADTFLQAKPGTSVIVPNLDPLEATNPSVVITYIEYIV